MAGIRLEWAQFGDFDSFDVLRSDALMDINALPSPIATNLPTMYYVDTTVIEGATYYYRVVAWRDGVSKVSGEVTVKAELLDMLNNISIRINSDSISDIGFDRYVWTQPTGAVYSEGVEADLTLATTECVADKSFDFTSPWVLECEFKIPTTSTLAYIELLKNMNSWSYGGLQISYGNTSGGDSYNKIFVGIYGGPSLATPTLSRGVYHTMKVQFLGGSQFRIYINDVEVMNGIHSATHEAGVPRIGCGFSFRKFTLRKM